ncbi:hypothetical protein P5673_010588 [Acropora cervicornis]|uniref:Uncharacterized protein n=1 Tax=Acropora cervicornis TaxID=6130 RepID=A0AAD9V9A4_ACRCE|nr:hypothetical protein P5673_010588 [Acropora cervicornis]
MIVKCKEKENPHGTMDCGSMEKALLRQDHRELHKRQQVDCFELVMNTAFVPRCSCECEPSEVESSRNFLQKHTKDNFFDSL